VGQFLSRSGTAHRFDEVIVAEVQPPTEFLLGQPDGGTDSVGPVRLRANHAGGMPSPGASNLALPHSNQIFHSPNALA
jgi:hypothetical protein